MNESLNDCAKIAANEIPEDQIWKASTCSVHAEAKSVEVNLYPMGKSQNKTTLNQIGQ